MTYLAEGLRVRYCRTKYSRFGLEGTVQKIRSGSRFLVAWDDGSEDDYLVKAFGPRSGPTFEDTGYIQPIDEAPHAMEQFLVAGVCGGAIRRVTGYDAAVELAQYGAAKSKSGQEYRIYRSIEGFQKEDPPIKHTRYTHDTRGGDV